MGLLWDRGPLTLAEVHQALSRRVGYTTVQTRLNRLVDKRRVARSNERPTRYRAVVARERVSAGHLDQLLDKVSGGRVAPLVAQLIERASLSTEDVRELKALIGAAERRMRRRRKA